MLVKGFNAHAESQDVVFSGKSAWGRPSLSVQLTGVVPSSVFRQAQVGHVLPTSVQARECRATASKKTTYQVYIPYTGVSYLL